MRGTFRKIISEFKGYIILFTLLIISLIILPFNKTSKIENLRAYAFGGFAVINSVVLQIENLFRDESKIQQLGKLNAELMLKINEYRKYGLENIKLKNLLGFKDSSHFPLIAASVVSKLLSKNKGNFIINAGRSDGVNSSMPVITDKGLVGFVVNTAKNFSLVRSLKSSSLRIAVEDFRSKISGILEWNGDKLIINNIPTTVDVKIGDRIITSSFSTIAPPSIPVGIIVKKENTVPGLLSSVVVEPFANIDGARDLFVVKIVENKQIDSLKLNLLRNQ